MKEAVAALEGGAELIDVKEPRRGALGRADEHVIQEIVRMVDGRKPVSAAMGEWDGEIGTVPDADLAYIKWGLAGCGRKADWRTLFTLSVPCLPQRVLVAYADWQCAEAPCVEDVFAFAAECPGSVMLVDTHCKEANNVVRKERPTLLDWLPREWVFDLCERCRAARVKIALAGSLGIDEIRELLPARPDWFAVRGAVCAAGDRQSEVCLKKVRELASLLTGTSAA